MDKKKMLIIGSIVVIIISLIASIFIITNNNKKEPEYGIEGIDLPQNKDILKDATVDDLKITDISLLTRDGISTYKAKVVNTTHKNITIDSLHVSFYEGETENKIIALQNSVIEAEGQMYINISSETDLSKTTEIKYELETKDE